MSKNKVKNKDIKLMFWLKWRTSSIPQKELNKISKRLLSLTKALKGKLLIHSISSLLNSYFEDLYELKEKIDKEVEKKK